MSTAAPTVAIPPPQRLTLVHWLILVMAAIGFAFDTYVLLTTPLIARPALEQLLGVDQYTDSGNDTILRWTQYIMWGSAISGGLFGLLGGYLTDLFGRRRILTWSILIYAGSALAAAFSTSAEMLLILRCTSFIGVCVEFVAAVAWLAELFPNPHQREQILGYTQAFSSIGGILVAGSYGLIAHNVTAFPAIFGGHDVWRYTLISGVIPAIPLIVLRPFLPESAAWVLKRAQGLLKRPSFRELFRPAFRRATLVSAALSACCFGVAFGVIQLTPQIVPGLWSDSPRLIGLRTQYDASSSDEKLAALKGRVEKQKAAYEQAQVAGESTESIGQKKEQWERLSKGYTAAAAARTDEAKRESLRQQVEEVSGRQQEMIAGVQSTQEIGGLVGRFFLAWLAVRIISRRKLLWTFLLPGLVVVPAVYLVAATGNLGSSSLDVLRVGIFFAGFFTVAQFSFWGNYLPRMYPMYLRGTGESFAANVGGRLVGTAGNPLTISVALPLVLALAPTLTRPSALAYGAGAVAFLLYLLGTGLTFALPEPIDGAVTD